MSQEDILHAVSTAAVVSGQEVAESALPMASSLMDITAGGGPEKYLPGICGGPWRTGGNGWLDDLAMVHENDENDHSP